MKKIPLRVIPEQVLQPGGSVETIIFDYRIILLDILRAGGVQGLTIGDMEKRLAMIAGLKDAPDDISCMTISVSDHALVCDLVKLYRFRFFLEAAIQFRDDILYAIDVADDQE